MKNLPAGLVDIGGDTPLVRFDRILGDGAPRIAAKLEAWNPSGSAKDRTARSLLADALERGDIRPGDTVVESSSGNLGVSLAQQCGLHGLDFVCVVDPRTNPSTRRLIRAYGGRLHEVTTPDPTTGDWLVARLDAVRGLVTDLGTRGIRVWWPDQYANPANPRAHTAGTMREIVDALGRPPDVMLVATSTTGTLGGCMDFAREHGIHTRFVAVDSECSVLFDGRRGERRLPGLGAGIVPAIAERAQPDRVERVDDLTCVVGCRALAAREGYLAGASGGGVVAALARLAVPPTTTVCVILPDGGERYLETVYDDDWVADRLGCPPDRLASLVADFGRDSAGTPGGARR